MSHASTEAGSATKRLTLRCQFCETWNKVEAARAADRPKCGKCGRPMLLDRPYPLTDETFDRTNRDAQVPVLVDLYADWCGPCKMMAPFVDELASMYQGKALVAKLDTDRAPNVSRALGIMGIPTTIVYRDGQEVARQSGALPRQALEGLLKRAL